MLTTRLYIHFTANPQKRKRLLNRYGGVVLKMMDRIFWVFFNLDYSFTASFTASFCQFINIF